MQDCSSADTLYPLTQIHLGVLWGIFFKLEGDMEGDNIQVVSLLSFDMCIMLGQHVYGVFLVCAFCFFAEAILILLVSSSGLLTSHLLLTSSCVLQTACLVWLVKTKIGAIFPELKDEPLLTNEISF